MSNRGLCMSASIRVRHPCGCKMVNNISFVLQVAGAFVACHGLPTLSLSLSLFLSFSLSLSLSIDPEIGILRRHFYELLGRS